MYKNLALAIRYGQEEEDDTYDDELAFIFFEKLSMSNPGREGTRSPYGQGSTDPLGTLVSNCKDRGASAHGSPGVRSKSVSFTGGVWGMDVDPGPSGLESSGPLRSFNSANTRVQQNGKEQGTTRERDDGRGESGASAFGRVDADTMVVSSRGGGGGDSGGPSQSAGGAQHVKKEQRTKRRRDDRWGESGTSTSRRFDPDRMVVSSRGGGGGDSVRGEDEASDGGEQRRPKKKRKSDSQQHQGKEQRAKDEGVGSGSPADGAYRPSQAAQGSCDKGESPVSVAAPMNLEPDNFT